MCFVLLTGSHGERFFIAVGISATFTNPRPQRGSPTNWNCEFAIATNLLGMGGRIGQAEADYTLFLGRNVHNLTDELDCVNTGDNF